MLLKAIKMDDSIAILTSGVRGLLIGERLLADGYIIHFIAPDALIESHKKNVDKITSGGSYISIPDKFTINDVDVVQSIAACKISLGIVAGFNQIMKAAVLELPSFGWINLHPGRIPQYRGGSPLNWQILCGENKVGGAMLEVDNGIDTGPIYGQFFVDVLPEDDIASMHVKVNEAFSNNISNVVKNVLNGHMKKQTQDESVACYWHQRSDKDGQIDWAKMSTKDVINFVRALTKPYPGAWTMLNGVKLRIFVLDEPQEHFKGSPGRVLKLPGKPYHIITSDGAVSLVDYSIEGDGVSLKNGTHLG